MSKKSNHPHYFKDVSKYDFIDVYRVLCLYDVVEPTIQHAIKKLLLAGDRGHKSIAKDIQEAIDSLERWKDMAYEDGAEFGDTQKQEKNILYAQIQKEASEQLQKGITKDDVHTGQWNLSQDDSTRIAAEEIRARKPAMGNASGHTKAQTSTGKDCCGSSCGAHNDKHISESADDEIMGGVDFSAHLDRLFVAQKIAANKDVQKKYKFDFSSLDAGKGEC